MEQLSEDQIALMHQVRDEWIHKSLFAGDDIDVDAATAGIEWMYSLAGLEKPIVLVVDSPLGVQLALNMLVQGLGEVQDRVYYQVLQQVQGQVSRQVQGQVLAQVYNQVYNQVQDQVRKQVYNQVWDQVENQNLKRYTWADLNLTTNSYWIAYYDFFKRINIVKNDNYDRYLAYLNSGVFESVFTNKYAVICRRPTAIRRDNNQALDSDSKPAIEFKDGYKLYFLHGVHFEYDAWKKIVTQQFTLADVGTLRSADQNAVAIQMLRPDRLLQQVNAKIINTGVKGTELYQVDNFMDTGETQYCMRMTHPTIPGREFIEWVEPSVGVKADADLCQAVAFGISKEQYLEAVEA